MNGQTSDEHAILVAKIARLVEEHGWSQEHVVRRSGLHRHTVRAIVQGQVKRTLRKDTIARCAHALQLSVRELRDRPLGALLAGHDATAQAPTSSWLYDQ